MANLYARLRGLTKNGYPSSQESTKVGHGWVEADLETWQGKISVTLRKDGDFSVQIGTKSGRGTEIMLGNVNDGERHYLPANRSRALKVA